MGETDLIMDALKRDLQRYDDSVDPGGRQRIMARMIDTVQEIHGCDRGTAVSKITDLMAGVS